MKTASDLQRLLKQIDHKGYPAYKDTRGVYQFPGYLLSIDHVQGDPFASPSKVSIRIDGKIAGFPAECYRENHRRIAIQDYLLRIFRDVVEKFNFKAKGSGKSGLLTVSHCGQKVLERTATAIDPIDGSITMRLEIGFPAHGRTICADELEKILFQFLPQCIEKTLYYKNLNTRQVEEVLFLSDDRKYIREQLPKLGLVAFVANGAILPRQSGVSSLPMKNAIPFQSPTSLEVTMQLPHKGEIKGMGINNGITLIVGGGYHGKSTLLSALELGVYDHIAGDGREFVITDADAVKIRAEDGRSVADTDISLFIKDLPNGKDTVHFRTEDASGSTSQAANVIEAIESGASALLIDEDTSATNFMVRDALMQRVVMPNKEPITPFIDRIRFLYDTCDISTILVAGSSGAFFYPADTIIQMDNYIPKDITADAKAEAMKAADIYDVANQQNNALLPNFKTRKLLPASTQSKPGRKDNSHGKARDDRDKIKVMGKEAVSINKETIQLHYVEQLVDIEQTASLGYLVNYAMKELMNGDRSVTDVVDALEKRITQNGLGSIVGESYIPSGFAIPRRQEIFACINRYRKL